MQLTKYKLGDLIAQRREKNQNYDVPIRGVSREGFINAKQQEADTSIYNVFYKKDFVFNPARMELNSIALNLEFDKALCSSLYEVFYVKDESIVLPEFLNLHIKRDEFARHCEYIGSGSAREYCRFAHISEFNIELPPLNVQEEIVKADRLIKRKIALNNRLIKALEDTAQAIYHHTFVENIDPENLPEGWRWGTIADIAEISSGKTINDKVDNPTEEYVIPVAGATGVIGYASEANYKDKLMTTGRVGTLGVVNRYYNPIWAADNVIVVKSKYFEFTFQILNHLDYNELTKLGVQSLITKTGLENYKIVLPSDTAILEFQKKADPIAQQIKLVSQEIDLLIKTKNLLLSKLS